MEEKLASRHEVASPVQQLSNGGVEWPQQQELTKENSQLKEEVSVLKKKVEDFKHTNSVSGFVIIREGGGGADVI